MVNYSDYLSLDFWVLSLVLYYFGVNSVMLHCHLYRVFLEVNVCSVHCSVGFLELYPNISFFEFFFFLWSSYYSH